MKGIFNTIMIMSAALALASCSDMWKEKTNNDWEERYVWSVSDIANGVLNNAYTDISATPDSYGSNYLDAATDNATTNSYSTATFNLANGLLSTVSNPLSCWASSYNKIQYIHSFMANGLSDAVRYDKVDAEHDMEYKRQYYGEALFLRAYWYFNLLQEYGGKTSDGRALGVPLVLSFISQADAAKYENFPRNTYEECVQQILNDLDSSMVYLPEVYTGSDMIVGSASIGKPSGVAAAALKSRVALYAASPAYQDDSVVKINGMGDFTVEDMDAYLAGWERAALIADSTIQMTAFGASGFYGIKSTDLADAPTTTPAEFIWRKYFNSRAVESRHFPPYYFGKANTVPSQNLVDAYPMANGYPITDPASGYDPQNPYEGRDKRFYLTVYYHGGTFGNSGYPINVMAGGKDSYTYNSDASLTGYYLAKGLSKNEKLLDPMAAANSIHYNAMIRRAEVFLNYAEAANEAWGPTGNPEGCKYTAYDVIKMVRAQSGGITDTGYLDAVAAEGKDAFRELIANERRLEFAFENQRYYDMRRCLMDLTEPVYGADIAISDGKVNYGTKKVADRKYNDVRYYYGPLPYDELVKNSYLVNNMGWK